ncbi:MAG: hypothetical protein ACLUUJ_03860 [Acutalibacteraceae bacterium]
MKGADCCLSGLQNQCQMMVSQGREPAYIARYCLMTIEQTLSAMTEALFVKLGELPLVFAGGVMSNSLIRQHLQQKFNAAFAEPAFSSDNAAGLAVWHICARREKCEHNPTPGFDRIPTEFLCAFASGRR